MHKIVHSLFELDLTSYGLSMVEENHWFSDQFFTKYSFPFDIYLTEELIKVFGYFLDDNNTFLQTTFNVTYYLGNKKEAAIFEIHNQLGKKLSGRLRTGFEELSNFDKKLSELPLEVIPSASLPNISTHAGTIISQKWPAVNYNYPQIYTEKYDTEDATWANFPKTINHYNGTYFPINEKIGLDFVNRNIIQPLPYLLHILTQGFLDAGYTLKGDILIDETIKQILVYTDLDYFLFEGDILNYILADATYDIVLPDDEVMLEDSIELVPDSKYKITGKISIFSDITQPANTKLEYKGNILAQVETPTPGESTKEIVVEFTTDSDTDPLTQILEFNSTGVDGFVIEGNTLFDLKIERELSGVAANVKLYDDVDLTRSVPDITFGKLIKELKNYFNIELVPDGTDMYINFIEEEVNYNNAIDLTNYEVLKPAKKFNTLDSLLLQFNNPSLEESTFKPVFQNRELCRFDNLEVNDATTKIIVDILPLIQKSVDFVETAFNFDEGGDNKIYFCLYDGLQATLNTTLDSAPLQLPAIHSKYHKKWFNFRLNSFNYRWLFKMYLENLNSISKKVYAYGKYHIIKSLEKREVSADSFEVEIETESIH